MRLKVKVTFMKYILKFWMGWCSAGNVLVISLGGIKKTATHAHAPGVEPRGICTYNGPKVSFRCLHQYTQILICGIVIMIGCITESYGRSHDL
jgi:hypothetical protein